ncbi:hypothetical protein DJ69_02275 [Halorubrum persicum]|uniref:Glycoside hydrolase family 127 protein n=1 Tax=Halorubrum persicum TaxID=1383844 RepID=A0A2G1WMD4_9EURY|nr:beta-L-arabinofuranosidase domain-containing protein [Halorubrum persicum]PHQ40161.1 hypothetical protein DJ69_02275 [Halorubrum persicum]
MAGKKTPNPEHVTVDDEFWSPRVRRTDTATVDTVYRQLVESGRLENLRRAAKGISGDEQVALENRMYRDESDVYKWLEAASYALSRRSDPDLESRVNYVISLLEGAQRDDGYLNSYFSLHAPEDRWTRLTYMHELYSAGHLFEAAVAHHEATGESRLLDVATEFADHVVDIFAEGGGAPGHQEVELALVRLYRCTGQQRYLDLARTFLDERGREDSRFAREMVNPDARLCTDEIYEEYRDLLFDEDGTYDGKYIQDHLPVREQSTAVGHAVRATYMYAAMADVATETGDDDLAATVERIWSNTVRRRMYVTGGLGSSHENEGFTSDYDLPNDTAYAETCAAVGSVMWNHRMLQLTGEGKYGDLMERTLYNALLAGISLDGTRFFYANPLESDGEKHPLEHVSKVRFPLQRGEWYDTPCCPPNVARLLASLGEYLYLVDGDELSVELYAGSSVRTTVAGSTVTVEQTTDYPWDRTVEISVHTDTPVEMTLRPRIPAWCSDPTIAVEGETVTPDVERGHVELRRTWRDGDKLTLDLPMPVRQVEAHPEMTAAAGRVVLQRGPVVYCLEGVDNDHSLENVCLRADARFSTEYNPDLLGGTVVVRGEATLTATADDESLYRSRTSPANETVTVTAVPYYAWANRDETEMRVWMRACDCTH